MFGYAIVRIQASVHGDDRCKQTGKVHLVERSYTPGVSPSCLTNKEELNLTQLGLLAHLQSTWWRNDNKKVNLFILNLVYLSVSVFEQRQRPKWSLQLTRPGFF